MTDSYQQFSPEQQTQCEEREGPVWLPDMRGVITLILLVSSCSILIGLSTKWLNVPENDVAKGALGSWFTLTTLAVQFYFGTTSQSKFKDETNRQQAKSLAVLSAKVDGTGSGGKEPTP